MTDRDPLPIWAEAQIPIDMDDAAKVLGVSRRYLVNVLRLHPYFEPRGTKKVFYPEHIARLRQCLSEGRETRQVQRLGPAPAPVNDAYERALRLATSGRRKST